MSLKDDRTLSKLVKRINVTLLYFHLSNLYMWFSDDSGCAVDVKCFAGAWEWQSQTTKLKI